MVPFALGATLFYYLFFKSRLIFDQGMRPTHQDQVIALYEAGLDEMAIARQTGHAQTSVGRYIRDYERVKLLLTYHTPVERISPLIGVQPNVVRARVALVYQH